LLNPFNLVAVYSALNGRAIWGVGDDYKLDFSLYSLFKVFGIPTLVFLVSWFAIKAWKKLSEWKLYFFASILSVILIFAISETYWGIVGRI